MNIAIDIDDTLTESFDYFVPFVAKYFGANEHELRQKNISYSNLPDEWKKDELGFAKTWFDKVVEYTPFKKGAAEAVRKLRSDGHKVIIITGRSDMFYTDAYETTKRELENGEIEYDKLICTLNKPEACIEEKVDILIDDMPQNCDGAVKIGAKALLFDSKANREAKTSYKRVFNWKQVLEIIESMAK